MREDFNNIFIGKLEDEEENQDLSDTSESEIINTSPSQVRVNLIYYVLLNKLILESKHR